MTEKPLFSIIVPIYNVEKYLKQCVDSLLTQHFNNYEIILVDDGSPDSSPRICDEYAEKSSRIKVVHKPNGGLSDARNAGMKAADGEYVTFVDSDDFWRDNNVLAGVSEIIEKYNRPDIIVSDFIKYFEDTYKYLEPPMISPASLNGKPKQKVLEYLYLIQADLKISACQKFVKREILINAPFEKGLLSEDIDWSLQIYPYVKSICAYPHPYYCYRQMREGSITNTASQRRFDCLMYIIDKWSKQIPQLNIPQAEKEIYLGYLAYQLSIAMALSRATDNRKHALERLRKNLYLFDYKRNPKTEKVYKLIKLCGLGLSCRLLNGMIVVRKLLKRG